MTVEIVKFVCEKSSKYMSDARWRPAASSLGKGLGENCGILGCVGLAKSFYNDRVDNRHHFTVFRLTRSGIK